MDTKAMALTEQASSATGQPYFHIAIARVPELHTSALYYERAAIRAGYEVTILSDVAMLYRMPPVDLLLVIDPFFGGIQFLPELDCPTAVVLIDTHRDLVTRAMFSRFFDHVLVAQQSDVSRIIGDGHPSVQWLPLGGDPQVHFVPDLMRDIDVGFVGKLGEPGTERNTVLTTILNRFLTNEIGPFYSPTKMGEIYSRSKIVFNKSIGGDVNMRVFEAWASGALLVTDRIGNGLEDLATEGVHYVGYDSVEEAIAEIERYLADHTARTQIAEAGQALLLERHTYDARLSQILDTVLKSHHRSFAPARHASRGQRLRWRALWARRRGITLPAAAGLLSEGLAPSGYVDLAVGLARGVSRWLKELGHRFRR